MKKSVVQRHHISYQPEITVPIYRGEHWLVTQLNRHKYISAGLVTTLDVWLALNRGHAIDLDALGKKEPK